MRRIALTAAFILGCVIPPTNAAETFEGTARVANRTIALPPGVWKKAASEVVPLPAPDSGPSNAMEHSATFLRVAGNRITGLVIVRASVDPSPTTMGGIAKNRTCERNDLHFSSGAIDTTGIDRPVAQDCLFLWTQPLSMPEHMPSLMGLTMTSVYAVESAQVPANFLAVVSRVADQMYMVEVTYMLDPEASGFPAVSGAWAASPWHPARKPTPEMDRMRAWAEKAQELTRLSFRNRPVTPLPEP